MKLSLQKLNAQSVKIPVLLFISTLVVVGTFPENDWSFTIGIDPPLKWVFNTLFETGLSRGKHIVFPHGPLAFLMYPLSENILLATLVQTLLKIILVFGTNGLLKTIPHPIKWLAIAVFAYGVSIFASFNHLLLAGIILLYLNFYDHRLVVLKYSAFFLTALAFYVKAYVAVLSGTMFVSFLVYETLKERHLRVALVDAAVMLGFMLIFQLLMFQTPAGFLQYLWGMLHLAQDNSAAAALYPYNNWFFLVFFMLFLVLIFALNRSEKSLFFTSLFSLSLFAAWKHGMAREDFFHVKGFLLYLVILFSAFLFFEQKKWHSRALFIFIALVLFGLNIPNSKNYYAYNFNWWQGRNFFEFIGHFNQLKTHAHQKTANNVVSNRMSQTMLDSISGASTDIYPWDYSVAAINELNWQPRPVIQSYAAYTSWLDRQNAKHWRSESAPEFVVWDKEKITVDVNKGAFNSIDYRYLLNDEPQSLLEIMSNYAPCCSDQRFLLLKKRKSPLVWETTLKDRINSTWNTWIKVQKNTDGLVRCKLRFGKSLRQQLKSFFYKDEQVWIYLKLENAEIHKYRIVPKNAADGIWINPYLFDFNHRYRVEEILFKTSNQQIVVPDLEIAWEEINFKDSHDFFTDYFDIKNVSDSLIFESVNTFELKEKENWSKMNEQQHSTNSYSGTYANQLKNEKYSCTFTHQTDSLPQKKLKISADAWVMVPNFRTTSDLSLVIEVKAEDGQKIYQSFGIEEQMIDEKGWNHFYCSIETENMKVNSQLIAYFFNPDKQVVYIDDFRVRMSTEVDY